MSLLTCKLIYAQAQKALENRGMGSPEMTLLIGTRIRQRRLDLGLRQVEMAGRVGISASYLNLIEHNRRRIAGKLLTDIARALGLDPGPLAEGAERAVMDSLRAAASGVAADPVELPQTAEFAGRFPGWAGLIVAQAAQIAALQSRVTTLTDRMAHDPALAGSLHDVISAVTAIQSTASILVSGEGIDRDWQERFHRNIHNDSRRLAETARTLVDYLERPQDASAPWSVQDEFARWLDGQGYYLAGDDMILPPGPVAELARTWISWVRADVLALPDAEFGPVAAAAGYDPAVLAVHFGRGVPLILRRLASLPNDRHPPMGLAMCDAAGGLTFLKPIPGFTLPRNAPACPLWPLYQSLSQPGRAIRADLAVSGGRAPMLRCTAQADWVGAGFDAVPRVEAVMLVQYGGTGGPEIGPTCRLCPRAECSARREPSILG